MATVSSSAEKKLFDKVVMPSIEPLDSSSRSSPTRGRKRRRHSMISQSPTRSPSPSRGHGRNSASRHRDKRSWRHHRTVSPERSDYSSTNWKGTMTPKRRRRSDAEPDHTFRGRARNRSGSHTPSAIDESGEDSGREEVDATEISSPTTRKRSLPPSRGNRTPNKENQSPDHRRQRSLPNQYRGMNITDGTSVEAAGEKG